MSTHDMRRYPFGFPLFRVVRLADGEFGVDGSAAQQGLHGLVAGLLLEGEHGMIRRGCATGGHGGAAGCAPHVFGGFARGFNRWHRISQAVVSTRWRVNS
jgi:hypothetical protein